MFALARGLAFFVPLAFLFAVLNRGLLSKRSVEPQGPVAGNSAAFLAQGLQPDYPFEQGLVQHVELTHANRNHQNRRQF